MFLREMCGIPRRSSGSMVKSSVFCEDIQVRCHPSCEFWESFWRKAIKLSGCGGGREMATDAHE